MGEGSQGVVGMYAEDFWWRRVFLVFVVNKYSGVNMGPSVCLPCNGFVPQTTLLGAVIETFFFVIESFPLSHFVNIFSPRGSS